MTPCAIISLVGIQGCITAVSSNAHGVVHDLFSFVFQHNQFDTFHRAQFDGLDVVRARFSTHSVRHDPLMVTLLGQI
eukprot:5330032-Pleurochrysis_carterae.AAC.1